MLNLENLADEMNEEADLDTSDHDDNAQLEREAQNDDPDIDGDGADDLDNDDDADDSDADGDDDQPDGESLDDKVIKWKTAAGEEFEAPVAELKQGYMRNQDYTHKMQTLARERDTANQQLQQQYQQVGQYAQELGALQMQATYVKQLEASIGQINRHDDPVGYNAAVNELLMAQRQRDGLAAQVTQIQQGRTLEQQQAFTAAQKQAAAELASGPNALPGFGKELVKKLNDTGRDYGLSDQDLAGIVDPRHIRILHDAMKYRELQTKKPAAVNKTKAAPTRPARQTRSVPPSTVGKALKSFDAAPSIDSMARLMSLGK